MFTPRLYALDAGVAVQFVAQVFHKLLLLLLLLLPLLMKYIAYHRNTLVLTVSVGVVVQVVADAL